MEMCGKPASKASTFGAVALSILENTRRDGRGLALQLPFCFEVRALSGRLVSSSPARPCDDMRGLNSLLSESDGDAADFLD
jgi:hypothetical protein